MKVSPGQPRAVSFDILWIIFLQHKPLLDCVLSVLSRLQEGTQRLVLGMLYTG